MEGGIGKGVYVGLGVVCVDVVVVVERHGGGQSACQGGGQVRPPGRPLDSGDPPAHPEVPRRGHQGGRENICDWRLSGRRDD